MMIRRLLRYAGTLTPRSALNPVLPLQHTANGQAAAMFSVGL
ncbi:hypothetical protein [Trichothermofontia sp.]